MACLEGVLRDGQDYSVRMQVSTAIVFDTSGKLDMASVITRPVRNCDVTIIGFISVWL